ncbi:hypothetical protein ABC795_16080 [Blastococcus sp. HT6-30]|uniref:hypothetical protein n=1 Tax=Blastococcus sp. HT6-30 TaxID=3144843 RepID=UPI0032191BC3
MSASPPTVERDEVAVEALQRLIECIDASIGELERARTRAEKLLADRRGGRPWLELVTDEARPLVVESISTVLGTLAAAGHTWRREEAAALHREQVSINRIAGLFGVTRQRISALLREPTGDPSA